MDIIIWLTVGLVVLFFLSVSLGYACYNLLKKVEIYEERIEVQEKWIDDFRSEVNGIYSRLKSVDEQNLFEADDDVGFVFSEIVRVAKEFNEKIQ